jgi:dephospho-CoA kinase
MAEGTPNMLLPSMLLIGLTGSIGMGKSTAAKRFLALGVPVIDADALVHELYTGLAVGPIEAAFPGATDGSRVDRQKLANILLADPSGFKRLESVVHPLVLNEEKSRLAQAKAGGAAMAVLEIPLLFETGGEKRVDVTVVVSAPAGAQRQRVLARPGMTEEKFAQILSRQLPDAEKRQRATFVVDTGATIPETEAQIDKIVSDLRARPASAAAYETHWL